MANTCLAVSHLLIIVALLLGTSTGLQWTSFGDKEYAVVYEKMTWISAQKYCEVLRGGLAHADTEERNKFLISLSDPSLMSLDQAKRFWSETTGLWLGASNAYDKKTWEWHNPLKPITFQYWASSEPNDFTNPSCMQYWKFPGGQYKWADLSCVDTTYLGGFICQRERCSSDPNDEKTKCGHMRLDKSGQKCMTICLRK